MKSLLLGLAIWQAVMTPLVLWPVLDTAPWERDTDKTPLLCEDALTRRRESERALASLGRERLEAVVDAKRLSEVEESAEQDIKRYCLDGEQAAELTDPGT